MVTLLALVGFCRISEERTQLAEVVNTYRGMVIIDNVIVIHHTLAYNSTRRVVSDGVHAAALRPAYQPLTQVFSEISALTLQRRQQQQQQQQHTTPTSVLQTLSLESSETVYVPQSYDRYDQYDSAPERLPPAPPIRI